MNIFIQFIKSLYSPSDIAKFRFQGIGKTILYVFLLILLSVLPGIYSISKTAYVVLDEGKQIVMNDLPPFSINNGTLESSKSKPVTVNKDNVTVLFDSTGVLKESDLPKSGNTIGLLKKQFVFTSDGNTQTLPYSTLENNTVTNKDIHTFLTSLNGILWIAIPVIFVFYYLFCSAAAFIKISIFAAFGLLFANRLGKRLNYRQSWRITAYSITLPTIFFAIMTALKTTVSGGVLLDWIVTLIFLFLSIREIPAPKKVNK